MFKTKSGFTIVELLIVIVVIGILAAITIVAYNGIQQRARVSSVSSALNQAAKKIAVWQVDNPGVSPSSLSTAGVSDTSDVAFQYSQTGGGTGYCITATTGSVSYKITENTQPTAGGCSGHGVGGVAAIMNLISNPSLEANTTGWTLLWYGGSGTGTATRMTDGGYSGSGYYRKTFSNTATNSINVGYYIASPVTAGRTYYGLGYMRSSRAQNVYAQLSWLDAASAVISGSNGSSIIMAPNTWTPISATGVAPASAVTVRLTLTTPSSGSTVIFNSGDTYDVDAAMLVDGNGTYTYADGNSPSWVWTTTTNGSTSTGPPL
ncbi:MAG: hypothetical protein JWM00_368 [Candidatus Saccharibacteria bacterium]|nr:hypothetical protein [Candidatus Saccharibacteria bacterium]